MQGRSKVTPNKSVFNDVEGYQDYSTGKATSISGIQIDSANPKKFTVKFTKIFCPALANVFGSAPMPEHIFGKYTVDNDPSKVVDEAPENNAPPVASGPFISLAPRPWIAPPRISPENGSGCSPTGTVSMCP